MNSLARLIGTAFDAGNPPPPVASPFTQSQSCAGHRRRKLWQLPSHLHCTLIGTCLPVTEMRKLAARAGFDQSEMSDYALHTSVVGNCDSRTEIAELVQRFLEKRYATAVQLFGKAKGEARVLELWREALAAGNDVAGALWAVWSHPDSEGVGKDVYGDIHMLSHQVGATVRGDLRRLTFLERDSARLRAEAEALRHGLSVRERDWAKERAAFERRLNDAEARAALLSRRELELAEARRQARDYANLFDRAEAMGRRIEGLEERNAANARRAESLATELNEKQDTLVAAEAALEMALGIGSCDGVSGAEGCGRSCPAEARLVGRCVLCIGGRMNLVEGYRRLVETQGGRFLHHDGGLEESLHRINAVVTSADAVICQVGCVSHAAYYRLKDACKKLGKPCVFLKSPGVGNFARGLAALSGDTPETAQVGRLAS